MRISDWSSDVCSSDLEPGVTAPASGLRTQTLVLCALIGTAQMTWGVVVPLLPLYVAAFGLGVSALGPVVAAFAVGRIIANVPSGLLLRRQIGRASCRERGCQYV